MYSLYIKNCLFNFYYIHYVVYMYIYIFVNLVLSFYIKKELLSTMHIK